MARKSDENRYKKARHLAAKRAKKLAYLRRRAKRGPLTANQKYRLEAAK